MAPEATTWSSAFQTVGDRAVGAWKAVSILDIRLWLVLLGAALLFALLVFGAAEFGRRKDEHG